MKYYNIQAVSKLCGLSTHCIRAWEKRYGAIKPHRSENGRRLYSESEVNRLVLLGKLCQFGHSIRLIAQLPDHELEGLMKKVPSGMNRSPAVRPESLVGPKNYLANLFMALQVYKLDVLIHELNKASMDLTCKEFALDVLGALFRKVGDYVQEGRMSIAQEHTLSAITRFFIGKRISHHLAATHVNKKKFILATPEGELHTIGLLLASLLLAEHEMNFIYLGESLPAESIADAARATQADVVLLGVSQAFKKRGNINDVSLNLKKLLPEETQLWVGGEVESLKAETIKRGKILTFSTLESLEDSLRN
ncbi:MAG: MerR family transcriptional regulator [Bacteriovoracia bacterium]